MRPTTFANANRVIPQRDRVEHGRGLAESGRRLIRFVPVLARDGRLVDICSRYALSVSAPAVIPSFRETADQHGYPASVLSDNAMYYAARFARGGTSSRNASETLLNEAGVTQKHSRPNHSKTCGKFERF